jgi:hypothetical protein
LLEADERHNTAANTFNQLELLQDKSMRMEMYLFQQSQDLYEFYFDKLREEVSYGGHVDLEAYLFLLQHMDEDKMKGWERRMVAEVKQLRLIEEDVKALQLHLVQRSKEIVLPDWMQDPQLRAEALQRLKYAEKY